MADRRRRYIETSHDAIALAYHDQNSAIDAQYAILGIKPPALGDIIFTAPSWRFSDGLWDVAAAMPAEEAC